MEIRPRLPKRGCWCLWAQAVKALLISICLSVSFMFVRTCSPQAPASGACALCEHSAPPPWQPIGMATPSLTIATSHFAAAAAATARLNSLEDGGQAASLSCLVRIEVDRDALLPPYDSLLDAGGVR